MKNSIIIYCKGNITRAAYGSMFCEAFCVDGSPPATHLVVSPDHKKRWFVCDWCAMESSQDGWSCVTITDLFNLIKPASVFLEKTQKSKKYPVTRNRVVKAKKKR